MGIDPPIDSGAVEPAAEPRVDDAGYVRIEDLRNGDRVVQGVVYRVDRYDPPASHQGDVLEGDPGPAYRVLYDDDSEDWFEEGVEVCIERSNLNALRARVAELEAALAREKDESRGLNEQAVEERYERREAERRVEYLEWMLGPEAGYSALAILTAFDPSLPLPRSLSPVAPRDNSDALRCVDLLIRFPDVAEAFLNLDLPGDGWSEWRGEILEQVARRRGPLAMDAESIPEPNDRVPEDGSERSYAARLLRERNAARAEAEGLRGLLREVNVAGFHEGDDESFLKLCAPEGWDARRDRAMEPKSIDSP